MSFDFSGQHVLVVGGSSGIGFAVARLALDLGARVTLAARSRQRLEAARTGLQAAPAILTLDTADPVAAHAAFAEVDPIDHLVLTAGGAAADGPVVTIGWGAAGEAIARTLAVEMAPRRVNVVAPGLVDTPGLGILAGGGKDAMIEAGAKALPVRFIADPEDVAPIYAAAMLSPYATGAVFDVNGGALL